jgi:3-deoxy-manno-octulosonate cytidylyltransferase (CMP-KDO synthetase)
MNGQGKIQIMVQLFIVIPARFASTRLPGKPLLKIGGVTMIEHVVKRALELKNKLGAPLPYFKKIFIIVATDHDMILRKISHLDVLSVDTDSDIHNGTMRVFEGLEILKEKKNLRINKKDLILNIQGDEPFFSLEDVSQLILSFVQAKKYPMGTLALRSEDPELFLKSSCVKVILDRFGRALYFSRAPIPFFREVLGSSGSEWIKKMNEKSFLNEKDFSFYIHHGIYLFRYSSLHDYCKLLKNSFLEETEGLEQLKALEAGWDILVTKAQHPSLGIDTLEDLKKAEREFGRLNEES